ncbi:uncharacterized protein LOC117588911 isoform X8 [Drosophila guanche]|nr:uncharacterized protein LOC117588911 isoform X8 [Drosophila guanche]
MYLIQTVQTTWRPQLPLPKELQLTDERHNDTKLISTKADIHYTQNYEENYQPAAGAAEEEQEQEQQQMDRLRGNHGGSIGGSSQQLSHKQKWSFGRLFRGKKKDAAECSPSSSEEDRKAGFVPTQRQSTGSGKPKGKPGKSTASRGSSRYEEQAPPPPPPHPSHSIDNEFFLPVETIQQQPEPYYQNQPGPSYYHRSMSNSLDRRGLMQQQLQPHPQHMAGKSRSAQRKPPGVHHSSAEEELISLNSSTFSKYRSDESIHSGGHALMQGSAQSQCPSQSQNSRRSRAARNERYYKRLSRDGEQSHGGVPPLPNSQRYKTQPLPLSIYQPSAAYVQWQPQQQPQQQQQQQQQQRPLQNTIQSDGKRSISYDSHIHLQNVNGRMQSKPLPPPPPPRDPLRRVHAVGSSSGDLRPVSYAFDHSGRCVSDDRIWQPAPHYQSVHSLNSQPSSSIASAPPVSQQQHHRRFITRSERNANPGKQSLPNGIDFHYVADATPRSRKPIHMMEADKQEATPPSSGMLRTSKSGLPTAAAAAAPQPILKPRSISSSRLSEMRGGYPMPMYSEVLKPKRTAAPAPAVNALPDQDTVVCGSLQIKPNYVEIRHRDVVHKTNSMPHHYQRRSGEDLPNKYEEYVAEKREQHQQAPPPVYPERKQSLPAAAPVYFPRKKPANLEEAINELEAIYKSLGLTEPQEPKAEMPQMEPPAAPKLRVPTPSDFEKFALAHADEYDDEDSPTGEPDPVRDDVAYRNLQLANLQHRSSERQPPFGIPVGPIVPAPQSDYLHVEPIRVIKKKKSTSPDIVKDDLAVRALRKDPPGPKSSFHYPMQKKQRATRTQSANIYNLIHRDAAKPSGGDLRSYMELTKSIERAGSMSNLQAEATSDIPATLDLLRKLKAQDEEMEAVQKKAHAIPFRHPSQGGAIAHLPERLISKEEAPKAPPVAAPRKSLTPEPHLDDALNKIAQDAQASSLKLSQELHELRREALITAARPKLNAEQQKLENELQEIDAVSKAAKRCGQMLLDNLPDAGQEEEYQMQPQRKLHKEGKLIRAIDEVSEAANAVCEKILKDIVTTEPPVIVHEARQVKQPTGAAQTEHLVMPNLIKKLDPIQSEKMEHIARRCMRQLSELAEAPQPDYDNLPAACNINAAPATDAAGADATLISTVPETLEEIDKIMQECERQAKGSTAGSGSTTDDQRTTAPSITSGSNSNSHSGGGSSCPPNVSTTASSFSSSSDCLAKSSSPSTASRLLSSSITSFNPYSSSDYIKSQSSDYHAPSTDPIKTFSTTSYDVQSTTANNTTNSTMSTTNNTNTISSCTTNLRETNPETTASCSSVSPQPLQLTPVRGTSSSPSQYNSSEELAAIFGIEEQPKQRKNRQQQQQQQQQHTGKGDAQGSPAAARRASTASTAFASASATTNAPAMPPATATTSSATNRVLNVASDVTTSPTSSNTSSNDSASNCSSICNYKLETIPEQEQDVDQDMEDNSLKLSPNFNRIYASKIRIVMDDEQPLVLEEEAEISTLSEAVVDVETHFDSLSSLEEEVSSNPDSGNVSLTDYPLGGNQNQHANASLELQTTYNSRFEVREHYVSEVSISASEESTTDEEEQTDTDKTVRVRDLNAREDGFPRLPTEEELLESLREELELNERAAESVEVSEEFSGVTELRIEEDALTDDSLEEDIVIEIQISSSEATDTEESEESLESDVQLDEAISLSEEVYKLACETLKIQEITLDERKFDEETLNERKLNEDTIDESELDEEHLDEKNLNKQKYDEEQLDETLLNDCRFVLEEVELSLKETEEILEQIEPNATEFNELSLDECDSVMQFPRHKSIVYETPALNLSISEVKLNYETKVGEEMEAEHQTPVADEANQSIDSENDDDIPINDTSARNENEPLEKQGKSSGDVSETRKGLPAAAEEEEEEQPTTSSKALSVFGEVRTVAPAEGAAAAAVGGAAARGGLTTLEHVFVACTVGLITPNDLLTLCLIVIGVIIIIAIALAA